MSWDKGSLISEEKEEVGKNWKVVTISHHLPPPEWCQASLQEMVSLENLPPVLLLSMMPWDMEYLWSFQVSCFSFVHSSPTCWGSAWDTEKALMLWKHCWATANIFVSYKHCFGHMWAAMKKLTPSQQNAVHHHMRIVQVMNKNEPLKMCVCVCNCKNVWLHFVLLGP